MICATDIRHDLAGVRAGVGRMPPLHGEDRGIFPHVPADGRQYEMDARLTHTPVNTGREARIHIVIRNADESEALAAAQVGGPRGPGPGGAVA